MCADAPPYPLYGAPNVTFKGGGGEAALNQLPCMMTEDCLWQKQKNLLCMIKTEQWSQGCFLHYIYTCLRTHTILSRELLYCPAGLAIFDIVWKPQQMSLYCLLVFKFTFFVCMFVVVFLSLYYYMCYYFAFLVRFMNLY